MRDHCACECGRGRAGANGRGEEGVTTCRARPSRRKDPGITGSDSLKYTNGNAS